MTASRFIATLCSCAAESECGGNPSDGAVCRLRRAREEQLRNEQEAPSCDVPIVPPTGTVTKVMVGDRDVTPDPPLVVEQGDYIALGPEGAQVAGKDRWLAFEEGPQRTITEDQRLAVIGVLTVAAQLNHDTERLREMLGRTLSEPRDQFGGFGHADDAIAEAGRTSTTLAADELLRRLEIEVVPDQPAEDPRVVLGVEHPDVPVTECECEVPQLHGGCSCLGCGGVVVGR